MRKIKIVLIGPMPPPSGGVSTHLSRLLLISKAEKDMDICVLDVRRMRLHTLSQVNGNGFSIIKAFLQADIVHIHISRKQKYFLASLARFFGKKVLYTHHNSRELSDSYTLKTMRKVDKIILVRPLVNDLPPELQEKCVVIPAYIPAVHSKDLPNELQQELSAGNVLVSLCFQSKKEPLLIDGKDLYGFDLIFDALELSIGKLRIREPKLFLADPAGAMSEFYKKRIQEFMKSTGIKVIYNTGELDFPTALMYCSVLIRATRSDGDSLSVREALDSGIYVVASDCVDRPEGVHTFLSGDPYSLARQLEMLSEQSENRPIPQPDFAPQIFSLYRMLINP